VNPLQFIPQIEVRQLESLAKSAYKRSEKKCEL